MEKSSSDIPKTVVYFNNYGLSETEQGFVKFVPEWINRMHSHFHDGRALGKRYEQKLKSSYSSCFIGDLRDRVGLSRNYYGKLNPDKCNICIHWANAMMYIKKAEDYEDTLDQIKVHMEVDHHLKMQT